MNAWIVFANIYFNIILYQRTSCLNNTSLLKIYENNRIYKHGSPKDKTAQALTLGPLKNKLFAINISILSICAINGRHLGVTLCAVMHKVKSTPATCWKKKISH